MLRELSAKIEDSLKSVRYRIIIVSGKGGVGKSFLTASLAYIIAARGRKVGILDADLHGPSIPKIMGLEDASLNIVGGKIVPVTGVHGVKVISMHFLLPEPSTPVIWRGPLKARAIAELLANVVWEKLDYLLIDLPPGTGDEPLSIVQLMGRLSGAVVVTMPSKLSRLVVSKALAFCRQTGVKVLGIVENMAWFVCPRCGAVYKLFGEGSGRELAKQFDVDYLGAVPLDPRVSECIDEGRFFIREHPESATARSLEKVAKKIMEKLERSNS